MDFLVGLPLLTLVMMISKKKKQGRQPGLFHDASIDHPAAQSDDDDDRPSFFSWVSRCDMPETSQQSHEWMNILVKKAPYREDQLFG